MLPSWFTKLRDVKAGSKQPKQHGSPPVTSKQQHEAPTNLTKSFSLRRASSKARNARFEIDILDACRSEDTGRPSCSSSDSDLCKGMQSSGLHKKSTDALLIHQGTIQLDGCERKGTSQADTDKNAESWDDNVSKLSPSTGSLPSTQKLGLVVSDNEIEDSPLTSETSSSFGSEMSSAESSVSSKCSSCEEECLQRNRIWQEGFRSFDGTCRIMQNDCEEVKVPEEVEESSGCANLMIRLSQENAEIRRSLLKEPQKGRQWSSFSSSMDSDGSSLSSNAVKSSSASSETRKKCTSTPILIKRNVNESNSRLEGDLECALLDNSALKQQAVDQKMSFKPSGRSWKTKASALTLDKPSQRENALSLVGTQETTARSILGAHQISFGDNPCGGGKCGTLQMQRRRQRGSSISAVLPPDLQGVVGDSLAFVKISNEPYEDFRQSMYEMIMEKDLEGSVDVEELLYCYLTLNSPEHHELIEEVFSDVWSAVLMKMR